jgi:hypothetical protein
MLTVYAERFRPRNGDRRLKRAWRSTTGSDWGEEKGNGVQTNAPPWRTALSPSNSTRLAQSDGQNLVREHAKHRHRERNDTAHVRMHSPEDAGRRPTVGNVTVALAPGHHPSGRDDQN